MTSSSSPFYIDRTSTVSPLSHTPSHELLRPSTDLSTVTSTTATDYDDRLQPHLLPNENKNVYGASGKRSSYVQTLASPTYSTHSDMDIEISIATPLELPKRTFSGRTARGQVGRGTENKRLMALAELPGDGVTPQTEEMKVVELGTGEEEGRGREDEGNEDDEDDISPTTIAATTSQKRTPSLIPLPILPPSRQDIKVEDPPVTAIPFHISPHRSPVPTHLEELDYGALAMSALPSPMGSRSIAEVVDAAGNAYGLGLALVNQDDPERTPMGSWLNLEIKRKASRSTLEPMREENEDEGEQREEGPLGGIQQESGDNALQATLMLPQQSSTLMFSDKILCDEPSLIPVESEITNEPPPRTTAPVYGIREESFPEVHIPAEKESVLGPELGASTPPRSPSFVVSPPTKTFPPSVNNNVGTRSLRSRGSTATYKISPEFGYFEISLPLGLEVQPEVQGVIKALDYPHPNVSAELDGDSLAGTSIAPTSRSASPVHGARRRLSSGRMSAKLPSMPRTGAYIKAPRNVPAELDHHLGPPSLERGLSGSSQPHSEYTLASTAQTTIATNPNPPSPYATRPPSSSSSMSPLSPSTPSDLNTLWNNAQGAVPVVGDARPFILNIFPHPSPPSTDPSTSPEHYTFGPSLTAPFYTIDSIYERHNPASGVLRKALSEIAISRRHPTVPDTMQHVCKLQLPRDGCPASDGLVTLIYPARAVAAALRMLHQKLNNAMASETAVNLAAEVECCRLVWSKTNKRYELQHPSVMQLKDNPLILELTPATRIGFDSEIYGKYDAGAIRLVNMTNRDVLVELDFRSGLLHVDTNATSKIYSPHIIDEAVAAVLAVGIMEGRRKRAQDKLRERYAREGERMRITLDPAMVYHSHSTRSRASSSSFTTVKNPHVQRLQQQGGAHRSDTTTTRGTARGPIRDHERERFQPYIVHDEDGFYKEEDEFIQQPEDPFSDAHGYNNNPQPLNSAAADSNAVDLSAAYVGIQPTAAPSNHQNNLDFLPTSPTSPIPHLIPFPPPTTTAVRPSSHSICAPSARTSIHRPTTSRPQVGESISGKTEREKKKSGMRKMGRGAVLVVVFIPRLGWEIGKAVVDVFRPLPEEEVKKAEKRRTKEMNKKGKEKLKGEKVRGKQKEEGALGKVVEEGGVEVGSEETRQQRREEVLVAPPGIKGGEGEDEGELQRRPSELWAGY